MIFNGFLCHKLDGPFDMAPHAHPAYELNYIEEGTATYIIGDRTVKLKKGMTMMLDARFPHKLTLIGKASKVIGIDVTLSLLGELGIEPHVSKSGLYSVIKSKAVGEVMKALRDSYNTYDYSKLTEYGLKFLFEMVEEVNRSKYSYEASRFIVDNYAADIKINDVADHLHISRSHLQRVFLQETGVTVGDHITAIRIKNAALLLADTDLPVMDVCYRVGIMSRKSFTAAFRKHFGMTPAEYRNSLKEKAE